MKTYTLTSIHPGGSQLTHTKFTTQKISDEDISWIAQLAHEVGLIYPESTVKLEIREVKPESKG